MRYAALLALTLFAAACTEEAAGPTEQGDKAAGEVLGGSVSDAMIPLEQLTSQAPLAPRQGPSATDIDSEQPEVTPMPGVNDPAPAAEAGAEAAPAPQAEPVE